MKLQGRRLKGVAAFVQIKQVVVGDDVAGATWCSECVTEVGNQRFSVQGKKRCVV
jgi:hypothetical protein